MDTPGSFGEWLKRRRKTLDLTREELAERASCSVFALRKIESGERRPSKQLAGLLANALEISEEDKPTFIRVARGDLTLGRISSVSDSKPASLFPSIAKHSGQRPQPAYHHLPLPSTPLLGRAPELAAMERIFNEPQCRLLTLTGMGGIGKTRLAIEFASRQRDIFPGGVHYVPLASINSAESIVPAIAEVLEFYFSGSVDPKEQLFNYLARSIGQSALLVLDNLEHLLAQSSASDLIVEILQRFLDIKILCTSRERLNLHGEWTYELHGLPIPPVEFIDNLEEYSAAVLFNQRARQINAEFELTDSEKPALVRICHLVEGIPLAIELAAAWVETLSCREIAGEIESNIDFLTTCLRDVPERHRSLKATFDHSWRLLSDEERDVLSRISVFHGGFDRLAAGKIAGATLPLLASLVSKSLVRRMEDGRYDLHEVIRQYALSHLEEESSKDLQARDSHSAYYLHFAAEREWALKSARQHQAIQELLDEMDNLRAAWVWAIQREKFSEAGEAVRCLGWFFEVSGLIQEGVEHFEPLVRALKAKPGHDEWQRVLGGTLAQQGMLCFRKGHFDRAQASMEESLAVLRPLGDQSLLVDALVYLGVITHLNGEMGRSQVLLEEGLACAQSAEYDWFAAYAIYNLGFIASLRGRYLQGREQMLEGMAIWRRLGDPHSISLGLNHLGPTLVKLGCYDEARAMLQESLELCNQSGNRWGMGTAYRYLGQVYMAQGDLTEAQALFHKSLETFEGYIVGWDIAKTLIYMGETKSLSGDISEAKRILLDALRLSREIHSTPLMLDAVTGLASLELRLHPEQVSGWLTLVADHPAATQDTKDWATQILLDVEERLGAEHIQATKERASDQSLEAIASLLS